MAVHQYWRLLCTTSSNVSQVMVASLELRVDISGSNLSVTGNGNASASTSAAGGPVTSAFDSNATTAWWSNNASPPAAGQWLEWDFGGPSNAQDIGYLTVVNNAGYDENMLSASLQYSDNNSTWADHIFYTGVAGTGGATTSVAYTAPRVVTADLTLPLLTLDAGFGDNLDLTLPLLTLDAGFGAKLDLTLPLLALAMDSGSSTELTLPLLTLDAAAHDSTGENSAELSLPLLTLEANFGAAVDKAVLPRMTLDAGMTGVALITVDLTLPLLSLDAQGTGSYTVTADFAIPLLTLEANFGGGVELALPLMTLEASITAGGLFTADLTLPVFSLDAQGTQQNFGSIDITLPLIISVYSATADLTLPLLQLDGIITAVVTASYEAYAINLNHTPRGNEAPVDEVTRYTNFPFTHIVRYQSSYFGVNSTGLYLLEGTTDYAATPTAIPWAFKTALTDFKTPMQKTVAAAYFGGRLGPASTVTLYAGEGTGVAYAHTTPRGATAQNYRQVFGKGVKASYYSLGAAGSGTLEIDSIEFDIHTLSRRI